MKILLAVDGSPLAMQAVRYALRLVGDGLKADFVLANVQEPATLYEVVTAHDPDVIREVRAAAGADLLAPAEAVLDEAGLGYESEVGSGEAAHGLLDMAERYGCEAILMGAHGDEDAQASRIGTVASAVLHGSPVPVTLVRVPAD